MVFDLAQAYVRVGRINDELGTHQHALPAYEKAMEILHELADANPGEGEYRFHLADATHRAAWAYYETGAAKGLSKWASKPWPCRRSSSKTPHHARYRELLERGLADRSEALEVTGQDEAAVENAGRSLDILRQLDEEHSESRRYRPDLALAHTRFGTFLHRVERFDEALRTHRAALEIYRQFLSDEPSDRTYRSRYAKGLSHFGETHLRQGNVEKARESFEEALELWQSLHLQYPSLQAYSYKSIPRPQERRKNLSSAGRVPAGDRSFPTSADLMRELRARNPTSLR